MNKIILYSHPVSSSSHRVRLAMNLKGVDYEPKGVVGKEGILEEYQEINPAMLIPSMVMPDGRILNESMAIIQYIEEANLGIFFRILTPP